MIADDEKVMMKIATGDKQATRQVVSLYLNYVITIAFRIIGDREEAEDIAQESFVKLWKQAKSWQPKAKISTWLYTVTRNACLNYLTKKKPVFNTDLLDRKTKFFEESEKTELFKDSRIEKMESIIKQLSERYRLVLTAFYFDEMKIKEAAQKFNLSEDAYESLLRRARARLKQLMQQYQDFSKKEAV